MFKGYVESTECLQGNIIDRNAVIIIIINCDIQINILPKRNITDKCVANGPARRARTADKTRAICIIMNLFTAKTNSVIKLSFFA